MGSSTRDGVLRLVCLALICVHASWAGILVGAGEARAQGAEAPDPEVKEDAGAEEAPVEDPPDEEPQGGEPVGATLDPPKEAVPTLGLPAGADEAMRKEVEAFQIVYLRYEREILEYRAEVNTIVRNEYDRRKAEIEAVYDKEIKGLEILERERRDEAIAAFEEFLRKYPRDPVYSPDVLYRLAELYFEKSNDDYLLADERYEQQRELYDLGRIADAPASPERNYDKTVALFQRLLTDFPDYRYLDGAYYLLGFCLVSTGKDEEARQAFEDLIRLRPESKYVSEAWVRIGEYYFDYNELDQAISAYSQALAFPENTYYDKALYKLAWSYYRQDRFEEAIASFKDLVRHADKKKAETGKTGSDLREEAIQYLAISLSEEDWNNDGVPDEDFGIERISRYLTGQEPYENEVLLRLGNILFDNTRYEQSIAVYRLALSKYPMAPDNPKILDKSIIALERLRRFDEAIEARRQIGLTYGPGTEWYAHQEKEGNREAMAFAEKLAQDNLIDSATWYHEQAQKLREEALSRQDAGQADQARERFSLAAEAYGRYLETYPHDREAYKWQFYLAECFFYSQQYEEAAKAYTQVRELSVGDNKYREQAAFNAIKALEFIIAQKIKAGQLPPESLARKTEDAVEQPDGKGGRDEAKIVLEPKPLPELVEALNKERARYVELGLKSPSDPVLPGKLEFEIARVYYDFRHLEEARTRFEKIINTYESEQVAILAAMLIMESYVMVNDFENMAIWADKIGKNPKLANNSRAKEIRDEAQRLKLGAMFKTADALMDARKYEEAAEAYIALINQDPNNQYADKALNNAAVAYENVKRFESAMKLYERVFNDYPKSDLAPTALFRVAFNAERFFDFDKAVRSYILLVDRYSESETREKSLRRAAVLLENLQDYESAASTYIRYATEYSETEDAPAAMYQASEVYEKMGDKARMIRTLNDFRGRFGNKTGTGFFVMEGLDKIATHYYDEVRDMKKAQKAYQDVLKEYVVRGFAAGSPEAAFAAKARFFLTEIDFKSWDEIRLAGNLKAQEKSLKAKLSGAQRLKQLYTEVYDYRSLEWTMAAGYRAANVTQRFAAALYEADIPFPEGSEEYDLYKIQLEDLALPLEDESVADYEKVIEKAREERIVNDWTKKVLSELNKYNPQKYPLFHEEKQALTDSPLSPLSPLTPSEINEALKADDPPDDEDEGGGPAEEPEDEDK